MESRRLKKVSLSYGSHRFDPPLVLRPVVGAGFVRCSIQLYGRSAEGSWLHRSRLLKGLWRLAKVSWRIHRGLQGLHGEGLERYFPPIIPCLWSGS